MQLRFTTPIHVSTKQKRKKKILKVEIFKSLENM